MKLKLFYVLLLAAVLVWVPFKYKSDKLAAKHFLTKQKFQSVKITGFKIFHWCGKRTAITFTALKNDKPIQGYVCTANFIQSAKIVFN